MVVPAEAWTDNCGAPKVKMADCDKALIFGSVW